MIGRLESLLGGAEALAPRTLPAMPAPLVELLPWRAWDESGEFYVNAGSLGFVLELPPFAGVDKGTLDALAGTLADSAPERAVVQVIHWTSPRYGAAIEQWAGPREGAGGLLAAMAKKREALFRGAGWRPLHAGGPPYTLNDCRVFLAASLPGHPGPAAETALGGFRRAVEGALASIGTWARRTEPDELLSLTAELVSPDTEGAHDGGLMRPKRRWSPRDPIHLQCAAPGRAMSVAPEGLLFHHPEGADVAVRVLTARAYPEVWPGWRGNALIGDFYRDFLQPGAPVLTALTVMMGEAADGERAFLKSARATQQAGTGIARYLPGLPEKARDWRFVTERLKEGERLVRACYAICVYAPPESMDEAEQAVRAIYHGQGWRLGAERYAHLPAWLSCLPMAPAGGLDSDLARLGRMKTLLTSSVVNLAPVHGEWRGQRPNPDAPPALLLVGRRGQPAPWSPFANEAGNYNVAV
ncbi:MAG: TraC family protein, partial [Nitrospinae bacterium]|nr:TraC family protein [Nitrospinota bacterium]